MLYVFPSILITLSHKLANFTTENFSQITLPYLPFPPIYANLSPNFPFFFIIIRFSPLKLNH